MIEKLLKKIMPEGCDVVFEFTDVKNGDIAVPCFAIAKAQNLTSKDFALAEKEKNSLRACRSDFLKNPAEIAAMICEKAKEQKEIADAVAVGPFANLKFSAEFWRGVCEEKAQNPLAKQKWLIEFGGPNTNKALHWGHARTHFLGDAFSRIVAAAGADVVRTNIINDRGIHICKSMAAYGRFGRLPSAKVNKSLENHENYYDGSWQTPENTGKSGDVFVGDFYALFGKMSTQESESGVKHDTVNKNAPSLAEIAETMLRLWEDGDENVRALWRQMNDWCLDGLQKTYDRIGMEFDRVDFESENYRDGKDICVKGEKEGIFKKREDGAIFFEVDVSKIGGEADRQILVRADGTSVYITQDIATEERRIREEKPTKIVHVVADEQNRHFGVLFQIMRALHPKNTTDFHHLAYAMVYGPEGQKIKSRDGVSELTMNGMLDKLAFFATKEIKKRDETLSDEKVQERAEKIGLAAFRFYILRQTPTKVINFDPEMAVKFEGATGAYVQYAYARARKILQNLRTSSSDPAVLDHRTVECDSLASSDHPRISLNSEGFSDGVPENYDFCEEERAVLQNIARKAGVIKNAAEKYNPAMVADWLFDLAQSFSKFYGNCPVAKAEEGKRAMRVWITKSVQKNIGEGMDLLGLPRVDEM